TNCVIAPQNGFEHGVNLNLVPELGEANEVAAVVGLGIGETTPRHQASNQPHDQAIYRLLIEGITDYAIFMIDPTGIVTSWNPGAERIKGYKTEEILGKHFSVFYPTDERNRGKTEHELSVALAEGRFEEEGWRVRKDGSKFWANVIISPMRDAHDQLLGFSKITRDLTQPRLAEIALRESEQRYRFVVEHQTESVCNFLAD